jgi:hypothetical protein
MKIVLSEAMAFLRYLEGDTPFKIPFIGYQA